MLFFQDHHTGHTPTFLLSKCRLLERRYPYVTIIQNFSQMWALYCLIQFYYETKHELHEINPLAKFLCFKAVVFVTWWQGVIIALLFATGVAEKWLPGHTSQEQTNMLQTNLQDFIICIEVSILGIRNNHKITHSFSFDVFILDQPIRETNVVLLNMLVSYPT